MCPFYRGVLLIEVSVKRELSVSEKVNTALDEIIDK